MPRRIVFRSDHAGDPQTVLQDDKDPMLTLEPDYLDCRSDVDPAGDLGKSSCHWTSKILMYECQVHSSLKNEKTFANIKMPFPYM